MNNFLKGIATLTIMLGLFFAENPNAVKAIQREKQIYDSITYRYAWEITQDLIDAMEEDRIFEGKPYKNKKGGKQND